VPSSLPLHRVSWPWPFVVAVDLPAHRAHLRRCRFMSVASIRWRLELLLRLIANCENFSVWAVFATPRDETAFDFLRACRSSLKPSSVSGGRDAMPLSAPLTRKTSFRSAATSRASSKFAVADPTHCCQAADLSPGHDGLSGALRRAASAEAKTIDSWDMI
jgi:hypothetical protein